MKKTGSIIGLGIVAILAITIIVLYLVPVHYAPKLDAPYKITIYKSSTIYGDFVDGEEDDKEVYDKVLAYFDSSLTRNLLSAIFAGQTQGGIDLTESGILKTVSTASSTYPQVVLSFSEPQTLVINGKTQLLPINEVIYELADTDIYTITTIYFKQISLKYYQYKTYAIQNDFYEFVNSLSLA